MIEARAKTESRRGARLCQRASDFRTLGPTLRNSETPEPPALSLFRAARGPSLARQNQRPPGARLVNAMAAFCVAESIVSKACGAIWFRPGVP